MYFFKIIILREGDIIDLKQNTMKKRIINRPFDSNLNDRQFSIKNQITSRSRFDSIADEVIFRILYNYKFILNKIKTKFYY
jgi:hypothetical protein